MKKFIAVLVLLFGIGIGLAKISQAGTPQETYFQSQPPLSATTIIASSASLSSVGGVSVTVATPTAINSGGGTYKGRNCFTKFVVQMSSSPSTAFTITDNNVVVWTIYGAPLGSSGPNTLTLPEDHLGPFCVASGDQAIFAISSSTPAIVGPTSINVEGYVTYGGTNNTGPMY